MVISVDVLKLQGNGTGMLAVFGGKLRLVNCTLRNGTGDWVRQIRLSPSFLA